MSAKQRGVSRDSYIHISSLGITVPSFIIVEYVSQIFRIPAAFWNDIQIAMIKGPGIAGSVDLKLCSKLAKN